MDIITCIAPVNIAVIKYWGKRNEELILPLNDSISATLCMDEMRAKTTVMASPTFTEDKIWLNGKLELFTSNERLIRCIQQIKKKVHEQKGEEEESILNWHIHICSENNFPTAAGLASSAAGYACLVYALSQLYGLEGDISALARQGSGSACRSIFGGFVQWNRGEDDEEGKGSIAEQIADVSHWPEMRIVILVVNDVKKKLSSTIGMRRSVETSELLKYRVQYSIPHRIEAMRKAITGKNFESFAEITMKDSNQFHAVALDTYPPAVYMNDVSHSIVELIHSYNMYYGRVKLAYTFDAGPNACLFMLKEDVDEIVSLINYAFPFSNDEGYFRGLPFSSEYLSENFLSSMKVKTCQTDLFKYIIITKVGGGPKVVLEEDCHLLNRDGEPKSLI